MSSLMRVGASSAPWPDMADVQLSMNGFGLSQAEVESPSVAHHQSSISPQGCARCRGLGRLETEGGTGVQSNLNLRL